MAGTRATSAESTDGATPLVCGLRTDEPQDTRPCPHECHGSLTLTDDERVVCGSCRCTPDGIYLPPESHDSGRTVEGRSSTSRPSYPRGRRGANTSVDTWGHDDYPGHTSSTDLTRVRMAGGYEPVYDEDETRRPPGVDDEYTFPLDSMSYERL